MSDEKKIRNSFADLGLIVAVTLIIVTIIRCLIFGIDWEGCLWIILAAAYCFVSHKYDSQSKTVKHSTTVFLALTVLSLTAMVFIDRKPQPKMHAFEGARQDTIPEEEFIQKEEPQLPELEKDTMEVVDTLAIDEEMNEENEGLESEETEPLEQSGNTEDANI